MGAYRLAQKSLNFYWKGYSSFFFFSEQNRIMEVHYQLHIPVVKGKQ